MPYHSNGLSSELNKLPNPNYNQAQRNRDRQQLMKRAMVSAIMCDPANLIHPAGVRIERLVYFFFLTTDFPMNTHSLLSSLPNKL